MRRRTTLGVLLLVLSAGCLTPTPTPTGGVEGTVWIGPTCPVVQDPPDPECDDRPFEAGLVLVHAASGDVAARFSSDGNGTFRVAAPPGTYRIERPTGATQPPSCQAGPFPIEADRYTRVDVPCDSGIR